MKTRLLITFFFWVGTIAVMRAQDVITKMTGSDSIVKSVPSYDYNNPAAAFGLSLLFPGFGQFYNGQNAKGTIMSTVALSSYITYYSTRHSNNSLTRDINIYSFVFLCGTYIWSLTDASISANTINRRNRALSRNSGNDGELSINPTEQYHYRNPAAAVGLSLLLPGLGQFYNGQTGKGVTMCVLYGGSIIILFCIYDE